MDYYKENLQEFIKNTIDVDMSEIYTRFEEYLSPEDSILDLGCGSGRDLKYFNTKYQAQGLEPSKSLADHARKLSNCEVYQSSIQDFITDRKYDAVWACASLLHIKNSELPEVFLKIKELLKPDGVIYCSFKYGDFEGERDGRYFNDLDEESFAQIADIVELDILEIWQSCGQQSQQKWLNILGKFNN